MKNGNPIKKTALHSTLWHPLCGMQKHYLIYEGYEDYIITTSFLLTWVPLKCLWGILPCYWCHICSPAHEYADGNS